MDGKPVYCRVTPTTKFAGTHSNTWLEWGTIKEWALANEKYTQAINEAPF